MFRSYLIAMWKTSALFFLSFYDFYANFIMVSSGMDMKKKIKNMSYEKSFPHFVFILVKISFLPSKKKKKTMQVWRG